MSTNKPQTKIVKKLETIALITAIIGSIIFVVSCLLNVYAYSITPTVTPTPTKTATVTRTPLPSSTPTTTLTPSPSPSPTYPAELNFLTDLDSNLAQTDFKCSYTQIEDKLLVTCHKETDDYSIQMEINRIENETEKFFDQIVLFEPFASDRVEIAKNELKYLLSLAEQYPWHVEMEAVSPTATIMPAVSVTPTAISEMDNWLWVTLPQLIPGNLVETTFNGKIYSLLWEEERLRLTIHYDVISHEP